MSRLVKFLGIRELGVADQNRTIASELVEREDSDELYRKLDTLLHIADQIHDAKHSGISLTAMPTPIAHCAVNYMACKIIEELERREQEGAPE